MFNSGEEHPRKKMRFLGTPVAYGGNTRRYHQRFKDFIMAKADEAEVVGEALAVNPGPISSLHPTQQQPSSFEMDFEHTANLLTNLSNSPQQDNRKRKYNIS